MTKNNGAIRQVGSGRYQARRWDKARSTYVSLGTFDTEDEARRAVLRADIMEESGLVPESSVSKDTSTAAGREAFATYAERALNTRYSSGAIQRSTFHQYSKLLEAHLVPYFGHMAVADIRLSDVEKWWQSMSNNVNQRRAA